MDINKTGAFIAALRKERGYTQKELADRLAVTDKAVSRWETGKGLPDTALLSPLASALGVTVGELLAGERIAREERSEKTDEVILDALRYARARISAMLCTAVLAVGIALLLSPLWLAAAGICAYSVLGLVLVVTALLRKLLERKRASDAVLRLASCACALGGAAAALVLEILPYGAVLVFAPGPGETLRRTFSYFSLTPLGYANCFPLAAGVLTVAAVGLCAAAMIAGRRARRLQNAAFGVTTAAFLLSVMPFAVFGAAFMSDVSWSVSALLLFSGALQATANR